MTLEQLLEKIRRWDFQSTGDTLAKSKYGMIFDQLAYHAQREWRLYLPAEHPKFNPNYLERLARWIGNAVSEDDQKLLLEYALYISFFSHADFAALYRTAMNREVTQWLAKQIQARLEGSNSIEFDERIQESIHNTTWFCPVTDSMDINEFYKINHLKGIGHRPGFSTLEMLATRKGTPNPTLAENVKAYMANPSLDLNFQKTPLERIVLLEDIVGSATQCESAVNWAVTEIGKPILFIPLILCPNGVEALQQLEANSNGLLTVKPIIELHRGDLLGPERNGEEGWPIAPSLESFIQRHEFEASENMDPFGYKGTGCSISTFANTPDNTIPVVHNNPLTGTWNALFPRVYRD